LSKNEQDFNKILFFNEVQKNVKIQLNFILPFGEAKKAREFCRFTASLKKQIRNFWILFLYR